MLTPELMVTVIGALIVSLGTILWYFFQRVHRQLDKNGDKLDAMNIRLGDKIDRLDMEHDKTKRDMSQLFTRLGTIEGFMKGSQQRFEHEQN